MLFKNKWNNWCLLIRVWDWCIQNCYNCYSRFDNQNYYNYDLFKDTLDFIDKKCETNFSFFLYWVDVIYHPELEYFLDNKIIWKFNDISIHIFPILSNDRINRILYISNKYKNLSFDTSYVIENDDIFKDIVKYIKFIIKHDIKSTLDLFLDFNRYYDLIKTVFLKLWFIFRVQKQNTHMNFTSCIELIKWNIVLMIFHTKKQYISNWRIYNIPNTWCLARKALSICNNTVFVHEEIDIDYKWNIKLHLNAYCSSAIKSISSVYKTDKSIINDINKFIKYMKKYDNHDMWIDCFNCIKKPYCN